MGKRSDSLLTYTYTDSERLKEAFFSPPKKKKADFATIKKIVLSFLVLILIAASSFLFLKYELIVVSKGPVNDNPPGMSLLNNASLSSFKLFKDSNLTPEETTLPLNIAFANQEKATMIIDLTTPLNLKEDNLFLYLKKDDIPLNMEIIARDRRFFSNSLKPLVIKVDAKSPFIGTLKIPINLEGKNMQNVNLSQINQLKLYFSIPKEEKINKESVVPQQTEWIVIKDLVITKKEGL